MVQIGDIPSVTGTETATTTTSWPPPVRAVRQPSAVRSVPHHAEYVSQVRGADDGKVERGNVQMKKCYGLCYRCVWFRNGGCSEWRRKHELR